MRQLFCFLFIFFIFLFVLVVGLPFLLIDTLTNFIASLFEFLGDVFGRLRWLAYDLEKKTFSLLGLLYDKIGLTKLEARLDPDGKMLSKFVRLIRYLRG